MVSPLSGLGLGSSQGVSCQGDREGNRLPGTAVQLVCNVPVGEGLLSIGLGAQVWLSNNSQ